MCKIFVKGPAAMVLEWGGMQLSRTRAESQLVDPSVGSKARAACTGLSIATNEERLVRGGVSGFVARLEGGEDGRASFVHEVRAESRDKIVPWFRLWGDEPTKVRALVAWRPRQDSNLRRTV